MNRIAWLLLLLMLNLIELPGLAEPPKYGEVSLESLQTKVYPQDPTMEAEIIYDMGNTYFTYIENFGFKIAFERKTQIKIYTQQGFERANVEVPYYLKDNYNAEMVRDIEGATYNIENGVIAHREISKKDVYEVDINEHWKQKVFALPNVKKGSVIEYKYTVISPFYVNLRDWVFQHNIPAQWSEYQVRIPGFFDYQMLRQGFLEFDKEETSVSGLAQQLGPYTYKNAEFYWALKDVPPFRNEKFITTPDDYVSKIEFQLRRVNFPGRQESNFMSTWDELIREMLRDTDFGRNYGKSTSEHKEIVAMLTAGQSHQLEKAKVLYNYLHTRVKWNGEMRRQPDVQAKRLLEEGVGNCTDINLLFVNFLNLAGIEAKPVLLSTRENGKIFMDYPFLYKFNYTIVTAKIDGKEYLLDATDPYLPFGMIPPLCLNGYGLVVNDEQGLWIRLESTGMYYQSTQAVMAFDSVQQSFVADITQRYDGFAAFQHRKTLYDKGNTKADNLVTAHAHSIKVENKEDVNAPLLIAYETALEDGQLSDLRYIPVIMVDAVKENPFKTPQRYFPVDFNFPRVYQYKLSLIIPEGYTVEELPEQVMQALEDNSVQFTFMAQHNEESRNVQVFSKIAINQSQVSVNQYPSLQQLYDTIVDKHAGVVVLRKIE